MPYKPTLGIAINCQNEAHHLPATIAQFYPVASEIVVIDGGSTDDSVEWAKRMGATVYVQPWAHNHAFQKNLGASKLSTDWVYIHDPDERLEPQLLELLPFLITDAGQATLMHHDILPPSEPFDCFGIPRRNYLDGRQTQIYPDYQYRLWKRTCQYSTDPKYRVHVEIEGFVKRTEVDYKRSTFEEQPRFNILHYKTEKDQRRHLQEFEQVLEGTLGEISPKVLAERV